MAKTQVSISEKTVSSGMQKIRGSKVLVQPILLIETQLQKHYEQLGGESFFGRITKKEGGVWYGERAGICYSRTHKAVFELHGAIYQKWLALGGRNWGIPDTDESPCWDGKGRYNHFNNGGSSIFWSPETGAQGIWGDIKQKWAELGWERSYLGYPTSDETDFPDGGRVNSFQHGGIYWWPDTGAIDLNDIVVNYTGLVCIKETGESSGADEPYALMGVITPFHAYGLRSKTYSSVDSNTSRPDLLEVYRGKPNGLVIHVTLMENDEGNPEKYKKEITEAVQKAHAVGTAALTLIPIVGVGIAAVLGPLIQKFVPAIGKAINDLFGFGDDTIGKQQIVLTGKDLIILARRVGSSNYKNVVHKFSTNNLRGENANYKVYFDIFPV